MTDAKENALWSEQIGTVSGILGNKSKYMLGSLPTMELGPHCMELDNLMELLQEIKWYSQVKQAKRLSRAL